MCSHMQKLLHSHKHAHTHNVKAHTHTQIKYPTPQARGVTRLIKTADWSSSACCSLGIMRHHHSGSGSWGLHRSFLIMFFISLIWSTNTCTSVSCSTLESLPLRAAISASLLPFATHKSLISLSWASTSVCNLAFCAIHALASITHTHTNTHTQTLTHSHKRTPTTSIHIRRHTHKNKHKCTIHTFNLLLPGLNLGVLGLNLNFHLLDLALRLHQFALEVRHLLSQFLNA
jgi:hypothetical protein